MIGVAWTIIWSFCYREFCRIRLWRHGPFSGLSHTIRFAAVEGGGMDHFVVFLHRHVTMNGSGVDDYLVFLSPGGLLQQMEVA